MKEKPILFSTEMVQAILEGRKTQTRRVVKGMALEWLQPGMFIPKYVASPKNYMSPFGFAGDQLWVRETFGMVCPEMMDEDQWGKLCVERPHHFDPQSTDEDGVAAAIYHADGEFDFKDYADRSFKWKPSIYMPRWASRITLDIVNLRIERLHDISNEDAICEGVVGFSSPYSEEGPSPRDKYRDLWEKINGIHSWDLNPWVWVIEFKKVV